MLKNHININDLLIKEPRLQEEWKATDECLNNFIRDAFNRVCSELRKLNIDTRFVMTPIFLNAGQEIHDGQVGNWMRAGHRNRVRRFVVKLTALIEGCNIILEGSMDRVISDEIVVLVINNYTPTGLTATATFSTEYNYYRFRVTDNDEPVNVEATIYLVETAFDDLVIYKTLENFFTAKYRKDDDNAASKMQLYKNKFEAELSTLAYSYDENGDGVIDDDDDDKRKCRTIRVGL